MHWNGARHLHSRSTLLRGETTTWRANKLQHVLCSTVRNHRWQIQRGANGLAKFRREPGSVNSAIEAIRNRDRFAGNVGTGD